MDKEPVTEVKLPTVVTLTEEAWQRIASHKEVSEAMSAFYFEALKAAGIDGKVILEAFNCKLHPSGFRVHPNVLETLRKRLMRKKRIKSRDWSWINLQWGPSELIRGGEVELKENEILIRENCFKREPRGF